MRVFRFFTAAAVACVLAFTGCTSSPPEPPALPLAWVDFATYTSAIEFISGSYGHVTNLPLATGEGADCESSDVREFSGSVEWHMIADGEVEMVADGITVWARAKWSFGEVDWSTIYFNPCTRDPNLEGWTTYVGGTGP